MAPGFGVELAYLDSIARSKSSQNTRSYCMELANAYTAGVLMAAARKDIILDIFKFKFRDIWNLAGVP